jgi:hypothetical protein
MVRVAHVINAKTWVAQPQPTALKPYFLILELVKYFFKILFLVAIVIMH